MKNARFWLCFLWKIGKFFWALVDELLALGFCFTGKQIAYKALIMENIYQN